MNCYHVRTNPGLEAVLKEEIRSLMPTATVTDRPRGRSGWVEVCRIDPVPHALWTNLRTAYEAVRVTAIEDIPEAALSSGEATIAAITRIVSAATLPEIATGETFAVRCRRDGDHPIQSPLVEREVGAVVVRRTGAHVNLTDPGVTVRADISGLLLVLGALATPLPLDRRFRWVYRPRVTLSTVVAAAALRIATEPIESSTPPAGSLLDPFCGSGTIAIEAAASGRWGPDSIYASDISAEAVDGTRANVACNGFSDQITVDRVDATVMAGSYGNRGITTIVCNPPFGVRLGRRINFLHFYRSVLGEAARILPEGGRLVLLSSRRRGVLNRVIAESQQWRILSVHLIEIGGVYPAIFALQRQDRSARTAPLQRHPRH